MAHGLRTSLISLVLFLSLACGLAAAQEIPPPDRGSDALAQMFARLRSTARLLHTTAHPDDDDGSMLVYESRGQGTETVMLTLNRGERYNTLSRPMLDALESALEEFAGCAVIISHDRWFLDRIATHILAFEGDSHVEFFDGNYSEYEADRKRRLGHDADTLDSVVHSLLAARGQTVAVAESTATSTRPPVSAWTRP